MQRNKVAIRGFLHNRLKRVVAYAMMLPFGQGTMRKSNELNCADYCVYQRNVIRVMCVYFRLEVSETSIEGFLHGFRGAF